MDKNKIVYVFDIGDEMVGGHWDVLISFVHPDVLLYAVWTNGFNNEPYFLDTIFYDECCLENINLLSLWLDDFYEVWYDRFAEMKSDAAGYVFTRCKIEEFAETFYIELTLI
jgi:hypothetical protein